MKPGLDEKGEDLNAGMSDLSNGKARLCGSRKLEATIFKGVPVIKAVEDLAEPSHPVLVQAFLPVVRRPDRRVEDQHTASLCSPW